jgi:hypothetical protein
MLRVYIQVNDACKISVKNDANLVVVIVRKHSVGQSESCLIYLSNLLSDGAGNLTVGLTGQKIRSICQSQ